jgi:hypothetical protein
MSFQLLFRVAGNRQAYLLYVCAGLHTYYEAQDVRLSIPIQANNSARFGGRRHH